MANDQIVFTINKIRSQHLKHIQSENVDKEWSAAKSVAMLLKLHLDMERFEGIKNNRFIIRCKGIFGCKYEIEIKNMNETLNEWISEFHKIDAPYTDLSDYIFVCEIINESKELSLSTKYKELFENTNEVNLSLMFKSTKK